jgi:hypothetical protein
MPGIIRLRPAIAGLRRDKPIPLQLTTRMRLRASVDARRDHRSRLQVITRLRQATAWQAITDH